MNHSSQHPHRRQVLQGLAASLAAPLFATGLVTETAKAATRRPAPLTIAFWNGNALIPASDIQGETFRAAQVSIFSNGAVPYHAIDAIFPATAGTSETQFYAWSGQRAQFSYPVAPNQRIQLQLHTSAETESLILSNVQKGAVKLAAGDYLILGASRIPLSAVRYQPTDTSAVLTMENGTPLAIPFVVIRIQPA